MRKLTIGTDKYTEVIAMDEPEFDANHLYQVHPSVPPKENAVSWCQMITFQRGPIKEHGVNGLHNEDLICIVIDRIQGFQRGKHACEYNKVAIRQLEGALCSLRTRTLTREAAGVEGTSKPDPACGAAQERADDQKDPHIPPLKENNVPRV